MSDDMPCCGLPAGLRRHSVAGVWRSFGDSVGQASVLAVKLAAASELGAAGRLEFVLGSAGVPVTDPCWRGVLAISGTSASEIGAERSL